MKKEEFTKQINPFIPLGASELVVLWLIKHPIKLIIKNDRKTKLGDFRAHPSTNKINQITINGGMNPYAFLITLVHEFAHAEVHEKYGRKVQAHGAEWKKTYQLLMLPYMESHIFPDPLHSVLLKHLRNPKASSHGDLNLVRTLALFDTQQKQEVIYLEDLPENSEFELNGKIFIKGEKRRTRFMCVEKGSNKKYTVSALAEINWMQE